MEDMKIKPTPFLILNKKVENKMLEMMDEKCKTNFMKIQEEYKRLIAKQEEEDPQNDDYWGVNFLSSSWLFANEHQLEEIKCVNKTDFIAILRIFLSSGGVITVNSHSYVNINQDLDDEHFVKTIFK